MTYAIIFYFGFTGGLCAAGWIINKIILVYERRNKRGKGRN